MTDVIDPTRVPAAGAESAEVLSSAGLVFATCDHQGGDLRFQTSRDNWLAAALAGSRLAHRSVERLAGAWSVSSDSVLSEVFPGCWCFATPVAARRRRRLGGYVLIFIPTEGFLGSELFVAMCQSALLDAKAVAARYRGTLPETPSEVRRTAILASGIITRDNRLAQLTSTLESVGQQLSESYEEINLLYTISQRMTVVQRPIVFVRQACEGLLETLPYEWIGVRFSSELGGLPSLSDRLVWAGAAKLTTWSGGDQPPTAMILRDLTGHLLRDAGHDEPSVLEPAVKPEHAVFAPLGNPVLVHPISREGRLVGIMVAGQKRGADRAASSADMKLLGATASLMGVFLENAALYEDMDAMFLGTLEAITASIDAKDRYTCGHSRRVAQLSQQLACAVGLDEETIRRVHVAGLVHDVGKIGVPEAVLCKSGRLTESEFALVRQHPEIGHRILRDIPQLRDVLPGVLHHHERWDGEGYPARLKGEAIPLFARLIALADSFDAMSSTRTYRSARKREWVLAEILRCSGRQFDPALVSAFIQMDFSEYDRLVAEHQAAEAMHLPPLEEAA